MNKLFNIYDLSFPTKVTALLIAIGVIGSTVYLTTKYVYGDITLSSNTAQTAIFPADDNASAAQFLPTTLHLKPGHYTYIATSPGYLGRGFTFTVYPFWHVTKKVVLVKDLSFENDFFSISYDYKKQTYLIVPKITIDGDQNPLTQMADKWSEYQYDANKALSYIKSQGVDPHSIPITWWAREWWPKGKSIKY